MKSNFYKKFVLPVSLLSGTIIGAGVFSLPFVFSQAGWLTGFFYLLIFPLVFFCIYLMYADVILKSGENFRFVAFIKEYLGSLPFVVALLTSVIGLVLALTIFLVLAISFLNLIVPSLPPLYKLLFFWLLGSLAIFLKIRRLAWLEFLITAGVAVIIIFVFISGFESGLARLGEMPAWQFSPFLILLPFGPVLFSFSGRTAIPSVIDYSKKEKISNRGLKNIIFWGTFAPAIVYTLFIIGVFGLSGEISTDAVSGIILNFQPLLFVFGILGTLTLLSTYIMIGLDIDKDLKLDLRIPSFLSNLIVIFAPLILYLAGFNDFIKLISLSGGLFLGISSILIILMWLKADKIHPEKILIKKFPRIFVYLLILVFLVGAVYSIITS